MRSLPSAALQRRGMALLGFWRLKHSLFVELWSMLRPLVQPRVDESSLWGQSCSLPQPGTSGGFSSKPGVLEKCCILFSDQFNHLSLKVFAFRHLNRILTLHCISVTPEAWWPARPSSSAALYFHVVGF